MRFKFLMTSIAVSSLGKVTKTHKILSNMKNHENIKYPAKYEVLIKQYLRSILDISVM